MEDILKPLFSEVHYDRIFTIGSPAEWIVARNIIIDGGNDKTYLVNITGSFSVPFDDYTGRLNLFPYSITGLNITIEGNGNTLTPDIADMSRGGALFYVTPTQTVTINNLTLDGFFGGTLVGAYGSAAANVINE